MIQFDSVDIDHGYEVNSRALKQRRAILQGIVYEPYRQDGRYMFPRVDCGLYYRARGGLVTYEDIGNLGAEYRFSDASDSDCRGSPFPNPLKASDVGD